MMGKVLTPEISHLNNRLYPTSNNIINDALLSQTFIKSTDTSRFVYLQ